jgi:ankyrin repeat protein
VGFSGKTALHCACADGRQGAVATLLATGKVDPNEPDKLGRTPMHLAALHGHAGAVAELLRASHKSLGAPPPPPVALATETRVCSYTNITAEITSARCTG